MASRHWRLVAVLAIVLAAAGSAALTACGGGSLTYSVTGHKGEITATVSDTRSGKHTVTVVLLDPPAGRHREFFSSTNNGSGGGGSGTGPLPSGVYSYAIYDLRGLPPHAETEWTPQHQIATGKVTVP